MALAVPRPTLAFRVPEPTRVLIRPTRSRVVGPPFTPLLGRGLEAAAFRGFRMCDIIDACGVTEDVRTVDFHKVASPGIF